MQVIPVIAPPDQALELQPPRGSGHLTTEVTLSSRRARYGGVVAGRRAAAMLAERRFCGIVCRALTEQRPPRVFISYSHDSEEHADRVLTLCRSPARCRYRRDPGPIRNFAA